MVRALIKMISNSSVQINSPLPINILKKFVLVVLDLLKMNSFMGYWLKQKRLVFCAYFDSKFE